MSRSNELVYPNILRIIQDDNPILREKAMPVTNVNSVAELCKDMLATLRYKKAAGIAAPQVGELKRIIIVEIENKYKKYEKITYTMINPEIIGTSKRTDYNWESCLSVSSGRLLVPRDERIKLKYMNLKGEQECSIFEGELARIIQHEYDHLDGILYTDKGIKLRDMMHDIIKRNLENI